MQKASNVKALILAAGVGSRLMPYTRDWPKCLMPIGERPLLEFWIEILLKLNIKNILINLNHHPDIVKKFLSRDRFKSFIDFVEEESLLGTAGTLRENAHYFKGSVVMLIHGDNWSQCDFKFFLDFHLNHKPDHCSITMMTFQANNPESCGIVELDNKNILINLHEKVKNPPGDIANAAVFLLDPDVISWLKNNPQCKDFSKDVLPNFYGRTVAWHNKDIHRDIGSEADLKLAQLDPKPESIWSERDEWAYRFKENKIHKLLDQSFSKLANNE